MENLIKDLSESLAHHGVPALVVLAVAIIVVGIWYHFRLLKENHEERKQLYDVRLQEAQKQVVEAQTALEKLQAFTLARSKEQTQ